jgi:hypothetical protein
MSICSILKLKLAPSGNLKPIENETLRKQKVNETEYRVAIAIYYTWQYVLGLTFSSL